VPPATLAEFTLSGDGNLDNYDGLWPAETSSLVLADSDMVFRSVCCRWVQFADGGHEQRRVPGRVMPSRP
jgi:hypothetical protein